MQTHARTFAELEVTLLFVLLTVVSMVPENLETFPKPSSPFHIQKISSILACFPPACPAPWPCPGAVLFPWVKQGRAC